MLIGINPLISPDVLHTLARMGHGDEIAVVDTNFPAHSMARGCVVTQPLTLALPMPQAVAALLTLIPADDFDDAPVHTMQVVGDPAAIPPAVAELQAITGLKPESLDRFAFYDRARRCFAIVMVDETRIYANAILRKGVIVG